MNLSKTFKARLNETWMLLDVLEEAQNETEILTRQKRPSDASVYREYNAADLSSGSLVALLSQMVTDGVVLSVEGLDVLREGDPCTPENIDVKCILPAQKTFVMENTHKRKRGGMRRTFSEILLESEKKEERDLKRNSVNLEDSVILGDDSGIVFPQTHFCDFLISLVESAGEEGITVRAAEEAAEELSSDFQNRNVQKQLDELCKIGLIRFLQSPKGGVYLSKTISDRFVFDASTECESSVDGRNSQIRPWRDFKGRLQLDFISKLQHQILSTVFERPGSFFSGDLRKDCCF